MPEGDTVWQTAQSLHKALAGHDVVTDYRVPSLAEHGGPDRVLETVSRGKHLLTRLGSGETLHTHLKMEGSWHLYRPDERWRRPAYEARVVLRGEEWTAVGFALGITEVVRTDAEDDVVGHLGPDLLGPEWDADPAACAAEAVRRLSEQPDRGLADALLDQRNLAGVGNLYANELCFLLGHHPLTPVREVDLAKAVDRSRRVLFVNRDRFEQSTTGDLRRGKQVWVYGRLRKPCLRCGTRIELGRHGPEGQDRASYLCPRCQPGEPASPAERRGG